MDSFSTVPLTNSSQKEPSIEDDFMYGNNVASSHIYIRLGFIRKVYSILSLQLLCTTILGTICLSIEPITNFIQTNPWFLLVNTISSLVIFCFLIFNSHNFPLNYYLLLAFTVCESFLVSTVASFYKTSSVIEAFFLTFTITFLLTLYTFQSKKDFSCLGNILFSALWIFLILSIMQIFFPTELSIRIFSGIGAFLFSAFIIFDTYLIMKKTSPEDYILATINLYMDIINLFIHILRMIGERRN